MKKTILATLFAVAVVPAFAQAADATINFTGTVVAATCVINGGTREVNVPMPTVATSAFSAVGDVAGTTPFAINLSNCTAGQQVAGQFEVGPNVDTTTGRLKIAAGTTGPATNVQIGLLDANGTAIRADGGRSQPVAIGVSGNGTLNFFSQYVSTAASVNAGKTDTSVQFSLTYN